jgi:EAL domain-containing protein (putative c-di-GMP-specific phosphodiesterase class I)
LTVEITESEKFNNPETIGELEQIHARGVRISIDDYGMGNSTVNYLRILPASELKIDRSFISNVLSNKSDRMVVASTIHLAHEMGLKVVAEGVESEDIQEYLGELQCDFIQGYHTGKPVGFVEYKEAVRLSESLYAQKAVRAVCT